MLKYLSQVEALSYEFIKLLAEALGMKSDALEDFFDEPENLQHRSKARSSVRSSSYPSVRLTAVWIDCQIS